MQQVDNSSKTILVVDDDELIVNLIKMNLQMEGYNVICAYNGVEALESVAENNPDMLILDIMMPEMDGFEVCKRLRSRRMPIILLTAKTSVEDKLTGLEMADDYIEKPFEANEFLARVSSLFRRLDMNNAAGGNDVGVRIDKDGHRILVDGEEMILTPREYDLLLYLMSSPDRVLSRDELLESVWGYEYRGDTRTVDMHIQRIRKKLGRYRSSIVTVFGVGYKYQDYQR